MSAPAWMPLYVADYLADTGHLSAVEHGVYMLLIMHYWQHDGLPDDDRKLARIARLTDTEWADLRDTISSLFVSGWRHKRIDVEMAKAKEMLAKRTAAGIAGASARYGNRITKENRTNARAGDGSGSNLDTSQTDQEEASPRAREFAESFWPSFPNHVDEKRATEAFDAARDKATLEEIMAGLGRYKAAKPSDREWMNPVTFLDNERWKDRPALTNGAVISTPSRPVVWIEADDVRWPKLAVRWSQDNGGKIPNPVGSKHGTGEGFHFPADWLSPS